MRSGRRRRLGLFVDREHREAVYRLMVDQIECGPFDGGCLVFAEALRAVVGEGAVQVVEGQCFSGWGAARAARYDGPLLAQHAVLALPDGTYVDATGRCSRRAMLARTRSMARYVATADAIRPMRAGDLPDAPRSRALVRDLAQLLADSARTACALPDTARQESRS